MSVLLNFLCFGGVLVMSRSQDGSWIVLSCSDGRVRVSAPRYNGRVVRRARLPHLCSGRPSAASGQEPTVSAAARAGDQFDQCSAISLPRKQGCSLFLKKKGSRPSTGHQSKSSSHLPPTPAARWWFDICRYNRINGEKRTTLPQSRHKRHQTGMLPVKSRISTLNL